MSEETFDRLLRGEATSQEYVAELHAQGGEWSAYAVTLNQRLERVIALARRRGIDEDALATALRDP